MDLVIQVWRDLVASQVLSEAQVAPELFTHSDAVQRSEPTCLDPRHSPGEMQGLKPTS